MVSEIFQRARKSKVKKLSDLPLNADDLALLEKYKLGPHLEKFIANSWRVQIPYSAGMVAAGLGKFTVGLAFWVPGVPSKDKVVAQWIYNRALINKMRGEPTTLATWEKRFLRERKLTDHFEKSLEIDSEHPAAVRSLRAVQAAAVVLGPMGWWTAGNHVFDKLVAEIDAKEEPVEESALFDEKRPDSLKQVDAVELVIFNYGETNEIFGIKHRHVIHFIQDGRLATEPIRLLPKKPFFQEAKKITRIRLNLNSEQAAELGSSLLKSTMEGTTWTAKGGEPIQDGILALTLLSKSAGHPWELSPVLGGNGTFYTGAAKTMEYLSPWSGSNAIQHVYVTERK